LSDDEQAPWAGPFPATATEEDIRSCFRLLLGRRPHCEEWPGHSSLIGHDLFNVVRHYVTSREFASRGMLSQSYLDAIELLHLAKFDLFVARDDLAVSAALRQDGTSRMSRQRSSVMSGPGCSSSISARISAT
jgi:hypothetical protein